MSRWARGRRGVEERKKDKGRVIRWGGEEGRDGKEAKTL